MPDVSNPGLELSPVKRALQEIRTLRARVEELEAAQPAQPCREFNCEPVAIIGAGLRFPGGVIDASSFWKLLVQGKDAITEIPRDRWDWRAYFSSDPDTPGAMYTKHGGFLDGVDLFDAGFFGVSPREATSMDPQHRLVLEVAWQALEDAGHSAAALQSSATGVFLGIASNDYGRAAMTDVDGIDAYTGSGNSPAMVAGRLSYVLGLHGPSLAIDTSCSSSLVAVHLACVSLRAGECSLALAGGVNLILSPESNVALSKAHMMAPDGRCKTFDEAADGYVRSEGCSIVVLKRLSQAQSDGDRILAVIRGSAVNHDGRSGGLTAPNGPAQAAVIQQALATAGVSAFQVGYVEAHGTGTALGDPIEVETLASVLRDGRAMEHTLAIGSVKTNIGHAEAASGIAGLMKAVLALQHREIPPSLHLNWKSSHIDWNRIPVTVPTETVEWKPLNGHRYAGVSSFGFSGTNAHVVLEEAPLREAAQNSRDRCVHVLSISARTPAALEVLRTRYVETLRTCAPGELADLCFTANSGRVHFAHRLAVVAETAEKMAEELERAGTEASTRVLSGSVEGEAGGIGFLFTGQGSQYAGMGRELYESAPVFREAMERCGEAWREESGESLIEGLYPGAGEGRRMDVARYAQPALFAFEYALAELWRSWGIEPNLVLGHSLGEYVAAVIAGVFSMEDGLRLVCARARLMDRLTAPGAMRAIAAGEERVQAALAGYEGEVGIGVVNGAESVVISGAAGRVNEIAARLEREGIGTRALAVTHGFHSPLLEPILDEFESCAGKVKYHPPRIRIFSNLTGEAARGEEMSTPQYWRRHMRNTVQFHAGLQAALATGCHTLLEIGPQPHLKALATRTDDSLGSRIQISLRRQRGDWEQMLSALSALYVQGHAIDWNGFDRGYRRHRIALPTYPFERQRYWLARENVDPSQSIWSRSSAAALSQSKLAQIGMRLDSFASTWETLRRLTIAEILSTLRRFGAFAQPGIGHTAASLAASCGIVSRHVKLLSRWLDQLCEAGYLERDGSQFVSRAPLPDPELACAWDATEEALRDDPFLLAYLRNCSKHLCEVLRGTTSPLETLFPGGSPDLARNLYENSTGARYTNLIVAAAVQAGCLVTPSNRRLRILELGGGTGATTAAILPLLPPQRVAYRFTDVSEMFLERARARFSKYQFVRYGLLDIENPPHLAASRESADIVIAANVVHATRNVEATVKGIAGLLVPGGMLVLLETTKNLAWHDITTALIEGWQKSDDDLRGMRTLMGPDEWQTALRRAGFDGVLSVPEAGSAAEDVGLHVILARTAMAAVSALPPDRSEAPAEEDRIRGPEPSGSVSQTELSELGALLRQAPPAERYAAMLNAVSEDVARVLRLPPNAAPRKRDRLMDLGMDSLMAVELRNRLSSRTGLENLPVTLIFDYPTPDAIACYLLERLELGASAANERLAGSTAGRATRLTAAQVEELADEEVATLLRSRLGL